MPDPRDAKIEHALRSWADGLAAQVPPRSGVQAQAGPQVTDHRGRAWRALAVASVVLLGVAAVAVVTLVRGRGDDGPAGPQPVVPADATTPAGASMAYADAFLHGPASAYFASWSSGCQRPTTAELAAEPDPLAELRRGAERMAGRSVADIHVAGAMVRELTATTAMASAVYDLPASKVGNDNWIPLRREHGRWRIVDCTKLPIGGSGTSSTPTDSRPHFRINGTTDPHPVTDGLVLFQGTRSPATGRCVEAGSFGTVTHAAEGAEVPEVDIEIDHRSCQLVAHLRP